MIPAWTWICAVLVLISSAVIGSEEKEAEFRAAIEVRKDMLLSTRTRPEKPVLLPEESIERAKRNIASADWAQKWFEGQKAIADYIVSQPEGYITSLIPEITPGHAYGFTCPNCVGKQSQEGAGASLIDWDYRNPDVFRCANCGQEYPSPDFPEEGKLVCSRSGQVLTYYINEAEHANPDDRECRYAWRWVGFPMHHSHQGIVRHRKAQFAISSLGALANTYAITGDPRYARAGVDIMTRLAQCYRRWLYHDYWDTVVDCDPMYAAWHAADLPRAWKLHPCPNAFSKDTEDRAAMLQSSYWGAGRLYPSTDSVTVLSGICTAYDLLSTAHTADGRPVMSPEVRTLIERDLILEWIMGSEPFVGGAGKADNHSNKAPRVYYAMAAVGRSLGIPEYVDLALRGYEGVRDNSFIYDGFSHESPGYTGMYLSPLLPLTEMLSGYTWPASFPSMSGTLDLYATDERLRLMLLAQLEQLSPSGEYLLLSDTSAGDRPSAYIFEVGTRRYPDQFAGKFRTIFGKGRPGTYTLFNMDAETIEREGRFDPPEIFFPAWMTAILRHGQGPDAAVAVLVPNPPGGHRHLDNLALYYADGGDVILGDLGYIGDSPMNGWIHTTASHNLVLVDGKSQDFSERKPQLHIMATSPRVSVVEASSNAYGQCSEYRRSVALVKEQDGETFLIDIFRVKGGEKHEYRISSFIADSLDPGGSLTFSVVEMPVEPPLPNFGQSVEREHIYGIRDIRSADAPPANWQAVWQGSDRSYRLWMASGVHTVEAGNGPGQTDRQNAGRRLRYLNAVRAGETLESTFVVVHEPGRSDGSMRIRRVERLPVPPVAGPEAVALKIVSERGTYYVFSDFSGAAEVAGIRFKGKFGVLCDVSRGKDWRFAVGASTFRRGVRGFESLPAIWAGNGKVVEGNSMLTDIPCPANWPQIPAGCTSYVNVHDGSHITGFPVRGIEANRIAVDRFPLPAESGEFELLSLFFEDRAAQE